MFNENTDGTQEPQATIVGMEFKPGVEGNIEIERLLGFESESFGGEAHRRLGEDTPPDLCAWTRSPDYCNDDALCIEMLEHYEVVPFILATVDHHHKPKSKKFTKEYVAVFELDGVLHVTAPFATESHAAACVLWFMLGKISHE